MLVPQEVSEEECTRLPSAVTKERLAKAKEKQELQNSCPAHAGHIWKGAQEITRWDTSANCMSAQLILKDLIRRRKALP